MCFQFLNFMVKKLRISATKIDAEINLPSSKSISNRALILSALSENPCEIRNLSDSDDTRVLQQALQSGEMHFDVDASGTAMRFLTAFFARKTDKQEITITGSERMKQRPIKVLVDALNSLGAKIEYLEKDGFPPLRIFGCALEGGKIRLNSGLSSQYISALMMIAPCMKRGLKITLEGEIVSKPYIRMTLEMMREFGVNADFSGNTIDIKPQKYRAVPFAVEADWTSASYWYELLAIAGDGKIFLHGLKKNSCQGDRKTAKLFENLGVKTEFCENGVLLTANEKMCREMRYNFINEPDLAQTFAVTCCAKNIPFEFSGLQSLKIKETDRISALIAELKKLGYVLREFPENTLIWNGERCKAQENPSIATYQDHRMAMAFAPIAVTQSIEIQQPEVVNKSYPNFWQDLALVAR